MRARIRLLYLLQSFLQFRGAAEGAFYKNDTYAPCAFATWGMRFIILPRSAFYSMF